MKKFIAFAVVCVLCSCNNGDESSITIATNADSIANTQSLRKVYESNTGNNQWLDSIYNIDFVQKSNTLIDSFSDHKHGIAFLQDTTKNGEINISAGYNGDSRFETYYSFIFDPKTNKLMVLDPVSGKKMTIEEFRKTLND